MDMHQYDSTDYPRH